MSTTEGGGFDDWGRELCSHLPSKLDQGQPVCHYNSGLSITAALGRRDTTDLAPLPLTAPSELRCRPTPSFVDAVAAARSPSSPSRRRGSRTPGAREPPPRQRTAPRTSGTRTRRTGRRRPAAAAGVAVTEPGETERPRLRQRPPPRVSLGDDGASSATANREGSPRWWGGAEVGDGVGALEAERGVQLRRGVPPGGGTAPRPI
jgi:hypothetical protein